MHGEAQEHTLGPGDTALVLPDELHQLINTGTEALHIFRHHGLDVMPGSMSTLISGDDAAVFSALQEAFRCAAKGGRVVMVTTFSNACPAPVAEVEQQKVRKEKEPQ